MPTYEYECQACGHRFDHFQSMSSRRLRKCPQCGKPKLIRLVGAGAGVIFKGSGFYETDYKRAGASKSGKSEGTSKGQSGGKDDGQDAKPAAGKQGDPGTSDAKSSGAAGSTGKTGSEGGDGAKRGGGTSGSGSGSKSTRGSGGEGA